MPLQHNYSANKNGLSLWEWLFFIFWLVYFSVFWWQSITIDEQGNVLAGHATLWADWAVHFTMGSTMAYRDLIPDTSPLMLGAKFSYPFATNMISALLAKIGVPFFYAFVIPSYIFSLLLVTTVYIFFRVLLRNRNIALLAACIFLFNGGIGFYYFILDVLNASQPFSTLLNPNQQYTDIETEHIKWISVISSMVIPQRSFAFGFATALAALTLIFDSFQLLQETHRAPKIGLNCIASLLIGFLPIIHTHSFLASFVILSCWILADLVRTPAAALKQRILHWLLVLGITSIIAVPILIQFFFGHVDNGFIKWYPGWYAKEFNINWFSFWFRNWTLVPFLAFFAIVLLIIQQDSVRNRCQILLVFLPGFILFLVPNLILTQPWIWDNTKLIMWSSIFISGLAAYCIYIFFHKNGLFSNAINRMLLYVKSPSEYSDTKQPFYKTVKIIRTTFMVVVVSFILSAGILDAYYTARVDLHKFTMYSQEELELAEWVKEETPFDSRWLTSTKHKHWLFNLTGRQAIITYTGWLWSHGYHYSPTEQDMKLIYRTADKDLIKQYAIQYVIIDNHARREMGANEDLFRDNFPIIKATRNYIIFATTKFVI